jgi:L-rhamnose mutarotase
MRTIKYAIFDKETNERLFTDFSRAKCEEEMEKMEDKEKFEIRYKWFSY